MPGRPSAGVGELTFYYSEWVSGVIVGGHRADIKAWRTTIREFIMKFQANHKDSGEGLLPLPANPRQI